MKESTKLPSGRELVVQEADFETGVKLYQTISNELAKQNLDIKELSEGGLASALAKALLVIIGSKGVYDCVWECLKRARIDGLPVSKESFQDMDKRADFIPCAKEVIVYNLRPFVSGLNLSSLIGQFTPPSAQE